MDTPQSIFNVKDFKERIDKARTDENEAAIVRKLMVGLIEVCPIDVLVKCSQALADARESEIQQHANSN